MAVEGEARYKAGDRVRVRAGAPLGHLRTPAYIRGKVGWIEGIRGAFRNPESLAYGGQGLPKRPLYLVGFRQTEVWERYGGSPGDTLYVDIYEHWLEPVDG